MLIRLPHLNPLQRKSLEETANCPFSFEEPELKQGRQGELATATAVAVLGLAALKVLTIWLTRKISAGQIRQKVVIELRDGTKITTELVIDLTSSEAPEAQVIAQIGKALSANKLPPLE